MGGGQGHSLAVATATADAGGRKTFPPLLRGPELYILPTQRTSHQMQRVGYIGLGRMGRHIANRLQRVGPVKVWNRTPGVANDHAAEYGTEPTTSLAELARCDIVSMCLPTTSESADVLATLGPLLAPGTVVIDHTSGDPSESVGIAERLGACRIVYVDAPVSGGPHGAATGTLTAMVGHDGTNATIARVLDSVVGRVVWLGQVGAGNAVKSVNNLLNVAHLLLAAHGLQGLKRRGIDPVLAVDAINTSSGRSLQTQERIPQEVLSGRYNYGFALSLMYKDVRNANRMLAQEHPESNVWRNCVEAMLSDCIQDGKGELDYTVCVKDGWV